MSFAFYLKSHKELAEFKDWQEQQRKAHGEYWLFSAMHSKPGFLKSSNIEASIGDMEEDKDSFEEVTTETFEESK